AALKPSRIGRNTRRWRLAGLNWAPTTDGSPLPYRTRAKASRCATLAWDPDCRTCPIEWLPWAARWRCAPRPVAGQPWPVGYQLPPNCDLLTSSDHLSSSRPATRRQERALNPSIHPRADASQPITARDSRGMTTTPIGPALRV